MGYILDWMHLQFVLAARSIGQNIGKESKSKKNYVGKLSLMSFSSRSAGLMLRLKSMDKNLCGRASGARHTLRLWMSKHMPMKEVMSNGCFPG
jgi:hypothetical protein